MKLSKKQSLLLNRIVEPIPNEIYVQGSVQSGKTFVITLSLLKYAAELNKYDSETEYNGAIIGWDLNSIKRNIIKPLKIFLEQAGLKAGVDYELKFGNNEQYFKFLNMTFYFFGFNTKLSFNKILGGPLLFIWIDEAARIYSNSRLARIL